MKKVVISKIKWFLFFWINPKIGLIGCSGAMLGIAEHIQSEKLLLIVGVVTEDECLGDLTALHEPGDTEQLAQSAFQVELVAFTGDKIDVAFATVKHV